MPIASLEEEVEDFDESITEEKKPNISVNSSFKNRNSKILHNIRSILTLGSKK